MREVFELMLSLVRLTGLGLFLDASMMSSFDVCTVL